MELLRAGIVGLGMMGRQHLRVLSNLEDVKLVGVVDVDIKLDHKYFGIDVFTSIDDLIMSGVDYVVVSTPTIFHAEITCQLIKQGIHVLVEKPLSHTYESALEIEELASSYGVIGAVGHIERYNSAIQKAKDLVQNGELGEIYQISTRRQGPFPSRISDVGVIKDLATHDIDLVTWITNKNYKQVSAQATFQSGRRHEDLVSVTGELEGSIVVNHLVNWLSPLKERKTIITGEKGAYVVDTLRADLTFYENGTIDISNTEMAHFRGVTQGNIHILAFEKPEPLYVEHKNFRDAILQKKHEIVSFHEGAKIMKIAEAIAVSAKTKETVKL